MGDSAGGVGVLRKLIGSSCEQSENWKVGHDQAMKACDRFELTLGVGVERFHLISKIDEMWNSAVACGTLAHDPTDEREITELYRQWLNVAENVAAELADYRLAGIPFNRATEFSTCLENARGICTPDEQFFAGPNLEAMRDRAIDAYEAGETIAIQDSRA